MNRARAALCGLTLALGVAGAAADDDDWLALFSSCVVSISDLSMALWTEFPDVVGAPPTGEERSFEEEAALLKREVEADPAGFLETVAEDGRYDMLGWQIDEPNRAIYMFLERPGVVEPLHYRVPFDLRTAIALQDAAMEMGTFAEKTIDIRRDPETGEVLYDIALEKRFYGDYRTDR